ncbi:hypothetical protein B0H19DRAFT_1079926 [Mycena capillaripes]|nr:hypothetical protein B0H19DRAFT_1079926 [Mycena capillaripes]
MAAVACKAEDSPQTRQEGSPEVTMSSTAACDSDSEGTGTMRHARRGRNRGMADGLRPSERRAGRWSEVKEYFKLRRRRISYVLLHTLNSNQATATFRNVFEMSHFELHREWMAATENRGRQIWTKVEQIAADLEIPAYIRPDPSTGASLALSSESCRGKIGDGGGNGSEKGQGRHKDL